MASKIAKRGTPTIVNSSVARTREYFTPAEIERLMATARKASRYGHRDATMILIAYRHGLRASELCDLRWHQVELSAGRLHVRRTKRGTPSVHPMQGDEIRALRRLQREQPPGPHVFATERGGPMAPKSFHTLIARLGERAKMPFPIHPHMLRHACGYALANAGHDTRALQALATATSSTPCATPKWHRIGSKGSGATTARPPVMPRGLLSLSIRIGLRTLLNAFSLRVDSHIG
jgi:integrase